jgi:cob(I)alamin adenosyltransferase
MKIPDLYDEDIVFLESEMDKMNLVLPELRHFIYQEEIQQHLIVI